MGCTRLWVCCQRRELKKETERAEENSGRVRLLSNKKEFNDGSCQTCGALNIY